MGLTNPLGLLNNNPLAPVRVEDVSSGLACGCYCAKCGARFVAVHCEDRQSYFRHHNADDCGGSFETAVHLMAKQALVETKCLMLPYLKVRPSRDLWKVGTYVTQEEVVVERKRMLFDRAEEEVRMDGRIPDVVLWKGDRRLLVEFVVTHDICDEKLQWIRERNLATVRVNLAWAGYDIKLEVLKTALRDGRMVNVTPRMNIISWVHHPHQTAAQERVNAEYLRSIEPARAVTSSLTPASYPRKVQGVLNFESND